MSADAAKEDAAAAAAPPSSSQAESTSTPTPALSSKPAEPTEAGEAEMADDPGDPDEDDLSDLDDVLDEFASTNLSSSAATSTSKPAPSASGPGRPTTDPITASSAPPNAAGAGAGPGGLFTSEDEFAKAMQAGMAELLGEFESNPEMARQFEDLVKELGEGMGNVPQGEAGVAPAAAPPAGISVEEARAAEAGMAAAGGAPPSASKAGASGSGSAVGKDEAKSFEDTIRATMERMNASNSAATASAQKSASAPEEDFLAAMLKEMEKEGGGLGGDEDFSKMLMGMMEQLTNKEILYEPMKELNDKFPAWMKENEGKVGKEDWERYTEQQKLVGEIVGKFEEKGYSDSNTAAREYIVERMQLMQAAGSPPPDLVGDMNAAQEALGDMDAGCPQQ